MHLRIAGVARESVVDGPGLRYVIFVQGCQRRCPGCHNPQTHDLNGGQQVEPAALLQEICNQKLLKGVTFSGGEPFLQPGPLAWLGRELKKRNYDIVTYSGYYFEELLAMSARKPEIGKLLQVTDWLIDGPFVLAKRDLSLLYRGSANQRIIDVAASLRQGTAKQARPA